MVAADERTGTIGQVTQLVRIDRHRVGVAECGDRRVHRGRREVMEPAGHLVARAQAAVFVAEQGGEIAAPGGIDMHRKAQPVRGGAFARGDHGVDRIDRAVFGGAHHRHRQQHRLVFTPASVQGLFQRIDIDPHAALRQQFQLRAAQPEQLAALAPRVVRGDRGQHFRHLQRRMRGEEFDQAELLDALFAHASLPVAAFRSSGLRQPLLPAIQQRGRSLRMQVECLPAVVRERDVGHAGRQQRHRKGLLRQCQPQRLVIGHGAAGGEMAEGAVAALRVIGIAEHACQLQADFDLQLHRHRRSVFADVVGVVGQGQDLCRKPGQQQVGGHVADVARAVERHRFLQLR